MAFFFIVTFLVGGRCLAGESDRLVKSHSLRTAETVSLRPAIDPSRLDRFSLGEGEDYFALAARQDQERQARHGLQKAARRAVRNWAYGWIRPWLADDDASGDATLWFEESAGYATTVSVGVRRWLEATDIDLDYGHGLKLRLGREIARLGPDWFGGGRVEVEPLTGSAKVTMRIGTGALRCGYSADGEATVSWRRTW